MGALAASCSAMACSSTVFFAALCLVTIAIASSSPEDQIVPETDISIFKDFEEAHDRLSHGPKKRGGRGKPGINPLEGEHIEYRTIS